MKAAVVSGPGQKPVYAKFDEPAASDGHCVVRVGASALSQLARARASGQHYSSTGTYPFVAGVDGAGRLDDGTRVYFFAPAAPFGAMAERTLAAVAQCIALPDALDDITAAAIAIPGMSSWAALTERARFVAGETVLINGATGASGQLAVQVAKQLGAGRIIATGRNRAVLDKLRALGADTIIPLGDDEAALDRTLEASFADGVDIVLDYLWGPSARAMLMAAARASDAQRALRFVQIGSISGGEIALPAAVLRSSAITLIGSGLGSIAFERLLVTVRAVLDAAASGGLHVDAKAVPLAELDAHWDDDDGMRTVFVTG
ncbi:zinc-containing alcohol dehydrogenase superfamily protein [Caballeronia fortuita]|uniref:Zinc-containing alcohol dehydrogenase superfamily protein n=1 Tax=Caballeronia fortuita TaxID=1777138 RepID=A0A158AST7_9BURK|nr:zinc-binding alcohol dehydrogenase family protein [Caballeronia fortuita]SAK60789.1 zinc-containing alcohol dehydrogenase superfamily protein [Caballeronia fortuita]